MPRLNRSKFIIRTTADLREFLLREAVLQRFHLSRLAVFGSLARNEKANDVDLLIEDPLPLESAAAVKFFLESKINLPVDVVLANRANPIILVRANREKIYVA